MVIRFLALLVLLGAIFCAGAEAAHWITNDTYDTISGAELWHALHPASLTFLRRGIESYIAPWVWDPVVLWILWRPAWLLLGTPALLVLWLKQPKLHPRFLRKNNWFKFG